MQILNVFVKISVTTSVISILFAFPLIYYLNLTGVILSNLSNYFIFSIISLIYFSNNLKFKKLKLDFKLSNLKPLKPILIIGIGSLIITLLYQLNLYFIRIYTIEKIGIHENGLLQSVIIISNNYFGIIFVTLSGYAFPIISRARNYREIIVNINKYVKYLCLIITFMIMIVVFFKIDIIIFLFSDNFIESANLLNYQIIGDFFKALSWTVGIWLVPKNKIKQFILFDIILNFNLLFIYIILLNFVEINILYFSVSYFITYLIHFFINYIYSIKKINFKFYNQVFLTFIISIVFIVLSIYLEKSYIFLKLGIILISIVWIWFTLSKNERFSIVNKLNIFKF